MVEGKVVQGRAMAQTHFPGCISCPRDPPSIWKKWSSEMGIELLLHKQASKIQVTVLM